MIQKWPGESQHGLLVTEVCCDVHELKVVSLLQLCLKLTIKVKFRDTVYQST